jgi:hypothetical protein
MKQQRVDSWWAQWTCVGGTCAPPVSPAASALERVLDAYTDLTAPFIRGCYVFVTVAVVAVLSAGLGPVAGLVVEAAFFLVAGTYCLANFSRCREAHCIVTGIGWSVLALVCATAVTLSRDVRSSAWIAFIVMAIAGHGFEAIWKQVHGSNALRLSQG